MGAMCARCVALLAIIWGVSVQADETDLNDKIAIELNTVAEGQDSCTLTFLVTNGHAVDIEQLVYETVLFDANGSVDRLTLFDFGTLPVARPRVRQFAVSELTCNDLGRILFNGLHTCAAQGLDKAVCAAGLVPSSRVLVEVLG
ncbi:MAG: hypothetical protein ABNH38_17655 [Tateyamaria sp.]|jgi:hypothetical protein|uniref:hypothetical protein n=1 Tax=Tateyamaria sp. TaxID=1929288 RepID=UPI0032DCDEA3